MRRHHRIAVVARPGRPDERWHSLDALAHQLLQEAADRPLTVRHAVACRASPSSPSGQCLAVRTDAGLLAYVFMGSFALPDDDACLRRALERATRQRARTAQLREAA